MENDLTFTIIVPAYNEEAYLGETIQKIKLAMTAVAQSGEIIVVDNNSTDDTRKIADRELVAVVHESDNQIAKARNAGARHANSPSLIFIDADTTISPSLLRAALAALDDPNVVGGGALLTLDREHKVGDFVTGLWNRFARLAHYAAGCFIFCRRDAFEEIGGFSERVYASEEIWLARALKKWAKPRDLRFVILNEHVITSGRKLDWLSWFDIVKQILIISLFPFALRYKRFCSVWYRRPVANDRQK